MIENNKQNSFAVHSFAFKQLHQCKYLQTSLVNISFSTLSPLLNKNNKEIGKQPEITTPRNKHLREKCPDTEFFLVRIFLYSDWIRRCTSDCSLYCTTRGLCYSWFHGNFVKLVRATAIVTWLRITVQKQSSILQNSQENTSARVSFLNKVSDLRPIT